MKELTVVTVTFSDREGGGLSIYSDDLPGLILSGDNHDAVAKKIVPAIRALFEYKGFSKIKVMAAKPISEILRTVRPSDVDLHVQHEQFVVEIHEAA
jgi:hypothetical protein